jgi:hypothetical protein
MLALHSEVHMQRLLLASALVLSCSAASGFPVSAPKGAKVDSDCIGPLKTLAPKLRTCKIAGGRKSRVWCPNGTAFDLEDAQAPPPLARSLCELMQVAE